MRPKPAHFARAHGLSIIHKTYRTLPPFRTIVDSTNTTHYNGGKFLASLLNPLAQNEFTLFDSFDVESLFTNVPLKRTVNIILNRIFLINF